MCEPGVVTICFLFSRQNLEERLKNSGREYVIVLLSEVFPDKLRLFEDVDAYVFLILKFKYHTRVCFLF